MKDIIPLRFHRQDQIVSGEAWRLYKEAHPGCKFSDFLLLYCQYFSTCSFQLGWFFLYCDGYALATEASSSRTFVKTEPLSRISDDCDFTYVCDVAENRGRNPDHVVELPFWTFGSSKLRNVLIEIVYETKAINKTSPFAPCLVHAKFHEKLFHGLCSHLLLKFKLKLRVDKICLANFVDLYLCGNQT
jgi:hypothetical protein